MNFLKRFKNDIRGIKNDIALDVMTNGAAYRRLAGKTTMLTTLALSVSPMMAADNSADIASFGKSITDILSDIYSAAFPIMTIAAAVLLVVAFIVRMTGNQQKAAQATSWIIRIIICYVCVNCIGLLFSVINNTTKEFRFDENSLPT